MGFYRDVFAASSMAEAQGSRISSVIRASWKVVIIDVVLLVALYYVLQDLQWRTGYASSVRDVCGGLCSYSPSFSYGALLRTFTMSGNGVTLMSPPTLDWVQLLAYALAIANLWFAYSLIRSRKSRN
jgi:hypothetical protein